MFALPLAVLLASLLLVGFLLVRHQSESTTAVSKPAVGTIGEKPFLALAVECEMNSKSIFDGRLSFYRTAPTPEGERQWFVRAGRGSLDHATPFVPTKFVTDNWRGTFALKWKSHTGDVATAQVIWSTMSSIGALQATLGEKGELYRGTCSSVIGDRPSMPIPDAMNERRQASQVRSTSVRFPPRKRHNGWEVKVPIADVLTMAIWTR